MPALESASVSLDAAAAENAATESLLATRSIDEQKAEAATLKNRLSGGS